MIRNTLMSNNDCFFIYLTESCNLQCGHCYVNAAPNLGHHMPLRVAYRAMDISEKLGINDVRFIGENPQSIQTLS